MVEFDSPVTKRAELVAVDVEDAEVAVAVEADSNTVLVMKKNETITNVEGFMQMAQQKYGAAVQTLQTDQGGEFTGKVFADLVKRQLVLRAQTTFFDTKKEWY
ncbi:hypothetical protein PybrP1_009944, partial [[Pythium] brassicae (nom. inval.)]